MRRALSGLLLTACTSPGGSLSDGFEGGFTTAGGCRDMVVYVANDDDTVAMVFRETGLVQAAIDTGGAPTQVEIIAADAQQLVAWTGADLTTELCDRGETQRIDETYRAVGGAVIVDIRPNLNVDDLPRVDVRFLDVALQDDASGELLIVADFRVVDVAVGGEP